MNTQTLEKAIRGAMVATALTAVATGAALPANAATDIYFDANGAFGTLESPLDVNDPQYWGGVSPSTDYNLCFTNECGQVNYLTNTRDIATKTADNFQFNEGDWSVSGDWYGSTLANTASNANVSVTKNGNWKLDYGFYLGSARGSSVVFTNQSGNVECTATTNERYDIGKDGGVGELVNQDGNVSFNGNLQFGRNWGRGKLIINGGTVSVASDKVVQFALNSNTIDLNGGTLETRQIERLYNNGNQAAMQFVNFNGGTLKANNTGTLLSAVDGYMKVNVNARGGTIDCNGYPITIKVLARDGWGGFNGTGALKFTGGSTITLDSHFSTSRSNEYNFRGKVFVTPGTILALNNTTVMNRIPVPGKNQILNNGVVLDGDPTVGLSILTSTSEFENLDLYRIACPSAPTTMYEFSDEGNTTIVVKSVGDENDNYWTGAEDNNLSNPNNWSKGSLPTDVAYILATNAVTLTKGDDFAPKAITFCCGSSPVTINGDFTTLVAVTNNSPVNQTFNGLVDFGTGDVNVTETATLNGSTVKGGCVVFAGGVKGSNVANHSIVTGSYTLTTDADFNVDELLVVNENASLAVANDVATKTINVLKGATLVYANPGDKAIPAKTLVLPSSGKATLRLTGDKLNVGFHVLATDVAADAASHLTVDLAASVIDGLVSTMLVKDGDLVLNIVDPGFAAGEQIKLADDTTVTLTEELAEWLNNCDNGDKEKVMGAAKELASDDFANSYLLNLDITSSTNYTFAITAIDVDATTVELKVTLEREATAGDAINGVLNFYGNTTLETFKSDPQKLNAIPNFKLVNGTFSDGDVATATIPKYGNPVPTEAFCNARIEAE